MRAATKAASTAAVRPRARARGRACGAQAVLPLGPHHQRPPGAPSHPARRVMHRGAGAPSRGSDAAGTRTAAKRPALAGAGRRSVARTAEYRRAPCARRTGDASSDRRPDSLRPAALWRTRRVPRNHRNARGHLEERLATLWLRRRPSRARQRRRRGKPRRTSALKGGDPGQKGPVVERHPGRTASVFAGRSGGRADGSAR